jgi:hypothetical protein
MRLAAQVNQNFNEPPESSLLGSQHFFENVVNGGARTRCHKN